MLLQMDHRHELEITRRSLAMLTPGVIAGLKREDAIDLIEEVQGLQRRLDFLKSELRRLAEQE